MISVDRPFQEERRGGSDLRARSASAGNKGRAGALWIRLSTTIRTYIRIGPTPLLQALTRARLVGGTNTTSCAASHCFPAASHEVFASIRRLASPQPFSPCSKTRSNFTCLYSIYLTLSLILVSSCRNTLPPAKVTSEPWSGRSQARPMSSWNAPKLCARGLRSITS